MLHYTVLKKETADNVVNDINGIYVDGTFGRGGHTEYLLSILGPNAKVIAFDQDQEAIDYGKKMISDPRLIFVKTNFADIKSALASVGINSINGIMLDLGFSSPQIDNPKRGFSYMHDGDLDMRMDLEQTLKAEEVINNYTIDELSLIFKKYGEEKFAYKIAQKIVDKREEEKIVSTLELVEIIESAIPQKFLMKIKGHSAKKVFQALRIEVNQELQVLQNVLDAAFDLLEVKGKMSIITFHSLEDRIVKHKFKKLASIPQELQGLPNIPEEYLPKAKVITNKPILPSEKELEENSRSRSAKLRVLERIR